MIAAVLVGVLALLGALHLFWALGGTWGQGVAIPEVGGRPVFRPSRLATAAVALGLFGAALAALLRGYFLLGSFPGSPAHWACVALGVMFLLRAVGEFRLVGFFKRVHGTAFAAWDTWAFSPLCLLLAAGLLYIATT